MYGELRDGNRSVRNAFFDGIDFCLKEHKYCWDEIEALFAAIRDGDEDDISEAAISLRNAIVSHEEGEIYEDNYDDERPEFDPYDDSDY